MRFDAVEIVVEPSAQEEHHRHRRQAVRIFFAERSAASWTSCEYVMRAITFGATSRLDPMQTNGSTPRVTDARDGSTIRWSVVVRAGDDVGDSGVVVIAADRRRARLLACVSLGRHVDVISALEMREIEESRRPRQSGRSSPRAPLPIRTSGAEQQGWQGTRRVGRLPAPVTRTPCDADHEAAGEARCGGRVRRVRRVTRCDHASCQKPNGKIIQGAFRPLHRSFAPGAFVVTPPRNARRPYDEEKWRDRFPSARKCVKWWRKKERESTTTSTDAA